MSIWSSDHDFTAVSELNVDLLSGLNVPAQTIDTSSDLKFSLFFQYLSSVCESAVIYITEDCLQL